jgi:hypothetical protein
MEAKPMNWIRTFENGADYIESIDGIDWHDAPLPSRWHQCREQTRGWFGLNYVERCACGATRLRHSEPWMNKNETRQGRIRQRKDAKSRKVAVTCQECGQSYEAVAGSRIAGARQCNSCWSDDLLRSQGYPVHPRLS